MDTEKYLKLQKNIREGKSPSDEGPFYHHSWWESYKGSIKGKFGGAVIGALVGGIVGGAVAAIAAATGGIGLAAAALTVAAFAGGGMLYGVHEFGDIGKVVGGIAAAQEQADAREAIRFQALEKKIDALADVVQGKKSAVDAKASDAELSELEDYRKAHYAHLKPDAKNRYVFWKVALVGLAVGIAAGALLAASPFGAHVLDGLISEAGPLGAMGKYFASMTALGAIGASFGINRDVFRKIFDKTDLWFKGIFHRDHHKRVRQHQIAAGEDVLENQEKPKAPAVATAVLPEGFIDYPTSSTYHRDKVLAAAEKALLSFDHTRATPQ